MNPTPADGGGIRRTAAALAAEIARLAVRPVRLMEVCGTHTVAIFRSGIRQLLPDNVELVSGPGCPICVTPNDYLDTAVAYARQDGVIVATFGDMLKVPGSSTTLLAARADGADVRMVYSPLDSLKLARENPGRKVIFLAVGFETTAPTAAAAALMAGEQGLDNYFLLSAFKTVPPALSALLAGGGARVDGFLLPGHVSAIIGLGPYRFLVEEHGAAAVVAGFEALDILQGVLMLLRQIASGEPRLENQYGRIVKPEGNPVARDIMARVLVPADAAWRGLGMIPASGLALGESYARFDALRSLPVTPEPMREPKGCRCGEVLRGEIRPAECPLFGNRCTPESPVGSCMVSVEGTCAAWHKYGQGRWQG